MIEHIDLPLIWSGLIALGVFLYVLLDGFDLGVGILFPFIRDESRRGIMMNSIAPFWDGNETWLVLGGGGLLAVFPMAYAIILPALYLPLMLMLLALIFRGVAFEFRFKATGNDRLIWDRAFYLGSIITAFSQGVVLGAFVQGIEVTGRSFSGGAMDWLSPFSLMVGVALVAGYALLGATWLIMKTEDDLQDFAFRAARYATFAVIGFMGVISLWVPFLDADIAARWFSWPNIAWLAPVPGLVALSAAMLIHALYRRYEYRPFIMSAMLFTLGYLGLGISLWPHIVPPDVTIHDAAAAPETQGIILAGIVILLPMILGYFIYTYWVFRGKVTHDSGYH